MSADKSRKRQQRIRKRLALFQTPDGSHGPLPEPPSLPLLLTILDTANELSCSPRHVYDLAEQGLLELVKLGAKSSRITSASAMRLAAQRAKPSPSVPGLKQFSEPKKEPQPQE